MQTKVHMAYRRFVYQWVHMWIFSQIFWLNVYQTNNDPKIIGGYFLEDVIANDGCPLAIRTEYGTENGQDRLKAVLLLWIFVLQVFVMLSFASVY